jgi:hypothetical protein
MVLSDRARSNALGKVTFLRGIRMKQIFKLAVCAALVALAGKANAASEESDFSRPARGSNKNAAPSLAMSDTADMSLADQATRQISQFGTVRTVNVGPGRVFKTPLLNIAPQQPTNSHKDQEEQKPLGQPGAPFRVTDDAISVSDVAPTDSTNRAFAPATFTLLRNSTTGPSVGGNGGVSNVAEPSIASKGSNIFETYNWYASVSTDNGVTRRFINPFTAFPNSPAAFTSGVCCDQRASQASHKGLVFWFLLYNQNGTTATSTGGVRLAVAKDNALSSNPIAWQTYDFFPEQIGQTGSWYDYPYMQVSDNFVYFTCNIFSTETGGYTGAVIYRIPLAAILANQPVVADTFFNPQFGSILTVNGSGGEGTRPAKNVMYFASVFGSNSVFVIKWPEANAQPTVTYLDGSNGLHTTAYGPFSCPVTIGATTVNPCGRVDTRMQAGWVNATELGLMWVSNTIAPNRPFPFTRVLILNPDTLAILSQPDLFSTTSALLYPAVAVNQRGHLGGIVDSLGGDQATTLRAFIRDDLSPDVNSSGWETFAVSIGNNAANAWGDYNGMATHQRFPNTWVGLGHNQVDTSAGSGARLRSIWFARERDATAKISVGYTGNGTATITSVPAGVSCNTGSITGCESNFALGTSVTLTIAPSAGTSFLGWTGACSVAVSSCTVTTDQLLSVVARILDGVLLKSGFENP